MPVCEKVRLNWSGILANFNLFHQRFYENSNQEYNLLSDYAFGPFTTYIVKILCQAPLPSFLT